jgi:hypothetical protein
VRKTSSVNPLRKRYRQLTARLAKLGLILQGTILERTIVRDDPDQSGKRKTYGPYYQWTWKRQGKTVTINLTAQQAQVYQKAIQNHRNLETILSEIRSVSLRILDATTQGVTKRKLRTSHDLRLS